MADSWELTSSDCEEAEHGSALQLAPAAAASVAVHRQGAHSVPPPVPKRKPQPARRRGRPMKKPAAAPCASAPEEAMSSGLPAFLRPCIGTAPQIAFIQSWRRPDITIQKSVTSLVERCLGLTSRTLMPLNTEASLLSISRQTLSNRIEELAAATHMASHAFCSSLISHILHQVSSRNLEPLAVLTHISYDETPMEVRLRGGSGRRDGSAAAAGNPGLDSAAGAGSTVAVIGRAHCRRARKQTAKIMQAEVQICLLCRKAGGTEYLLFWVPLSCPLLSLESNTAELIVAMLKEHLNVPLLTTARAAFPMRIDLTTSDRASSNIKAEMHMRREAMDTWRLSIHCCIHMAHSVQMRAFDTAKNVVSGIIAFARSQKGASAFDTLQEQAFYVLRSRVKVAKTFPPANCAFSARRDALFQLLLPDTPVGQQSRIRLKYLLTGDLASNQIIFHAGPGPDPDLDMWATELSELLLPKQIPIFQRHRWLNGLSPLQSCALLGNVHNVLKQAIPRWIALLRRKAPDTIDSSDSEEQWAHDVVGIPKGPDGQPDWKAWNERQRGDTKLFAAGGYESIMLVLCIISKPLVQLLHSMEERASSEWMARVFHSWMGSTGEHADDQNTPAPACRMVDAATLRITQKFFREMFDLLFYDSAWHSLALHHRTQRESSFAFCGLSRTTCAAYQMLHRPQTGYPFRLFLLLQPGADRASIIEDIRGTPRCLLDAFSRDYLRRYINELGSPESLAVLQAIACMQARRSYGKCNRYP